MTVTEVPVRPAWLDVSSAVGLFRVLPVRTPWLTADDDLATALRAALPELRRTDTVVISEKVAVLLTGGAVPIAAARPGLLASALARCVRPRQGSRGLSVPEKMQYVVDTVGAPRVLLAALVGAATRPLGRHGAFYRVAGSVARDLDGGRPPYLDLLFPPLSPQAARALCGDLERHLGVGVAVVDLNDYGGTIRAASPTSLAPTDLLLVLAGNPLGQRSTGTPFGVVRRVTAAQPQDAVTSPPARPRTRRAGPARRSAAPEGAAGVAA